MVLEAVAVGDIGVLVEGGRQYQQSLQCWHWFGGVSVKDAVAAAAGVGVGVGVSIIRVAVRIRDPGCIYYTHVTRPV